MQERLSISRVRARKPGDPYQMLLKAVESIRDYAIFMLDPKGVILTWNAGAERIKGYTEREIVGCRFSRFYTEEDLRRNHPQEELEIAASQGTFEEEGWRVRKDGSRFWANILITRLIDSEGRLVGFSKVTRDLTERRNAEEALRSAQNSLRRANEDLELRVAKRTEELREAKKALEVSLKARDEFLSIASHELKTPITSLKLQAQMARAKVNSRTHDLLSREKLSRSLETIIYQANRLNTLIEDLLDVSRVRLGKLNYRFESADLSALVEESASRWKDPLEAVGCVLRLRVEPRIMASVDSYRIEQVLSNLLSNAAKYAPDKPVAVSLSKEGNFAILKVEDQGAGIDSSALGEIFERYARAPSAQNISGLGLGLFITRTIVEAHHGSIRAESRPGAGSTFIVCLPLDMKHVS